MTKYDDVDWHLDGAVEAGQPEENAFAHIGLYLSWLVQRDQVETWWLTAEDLRAAKAGEITGSDLADTTDGKLMSDFIAEDGRAFTDWYYERYLDDFALEFDDLPLYGVGDSQSAQARLHPVLDRRYAEWVSAKRPERRTQAEDQKAANSPKEFTGMMVGGLGGTDELRPEAAAALESFLTQLQKTGVTVLKAPPEPHAAPDLESLIPPDLGPNRAVSSTTAILWRSATLDRVLRKLDVARKDAVVVIGMAGRGDEAVTADITRFPGITEDELWDVVPTLAKQPGAKCRMRSHGSVDVYWCSRLEFQSATWVRGDLVFRASATDEQRLEALLNRWLQEL